MKPIKPWIKKVIAEHFMQQYACAVYLDAGGLKKIQGRDHDHLRELAE